MYPGNESEKPVLRDVINRLKKQNNITGKTIHVADKGLNCAQNIAFSKQNADGYLFSKSVKGLSEKEKEWVLLGEDFNATKSTEWLKRQSHWQSPKQKGPNMVKPENM